MLPMTPHSPAFHHPNSYQPRPNPAVFITALFTLHKHMAPHGSIPNTTKQTHTPVYNKKDIPAVIYPWRYNHIGSTFFFHNTGHTQIILIFWKVNGMSRLAMKIQTSLSDYGTHQRSHPHTDCVMHC